MGNRYLALAAIVGISLPAHSEEIKQDGLLKSRDGWVAAALAFGPAERIVAAYVASGSEGEKLEMILWSEVRLLDVASGKYRVLDRAATRATLPGIGANHALRGFTTDGKKLVVTSKGPGGNVREMLLNIAEPKEQSKADAPKGKVNPHRLKGMKEALADLDRGLLRLKQIPPPSPPWYEQYLALLKKECGVEMINVDTADQAAIAEMGGYNDLMLAEIEHRHGKGILNKLGEQAKKDFEAKRK